MNRSDSGQSVLNVSDAARRLGVSVKALRLYEQQGLLRPGRTTAGYRVYGELEMARAAEVVALRALGLSLAQVNRVLNGEPQALASALAEHEDALEGEIRAQIRRLESVRRLRAELAAGRMPADGTLPDLIGRTGPSIAFDLPWPWGGERFELRDIPALTYLIGPLGSGKTRLAMHLAKVLPNAIFLGLDRLRAGRADALAEIDRKASLRRKVDRAMGWLRDEGASDSEALSVLLGAFEGDGTGAVVVDMIEQDLPRHTQEALSRYLRQRAKTLTRPLFLMTRSSSILDLTAVGPDEAIVLCPANHSPPVRVAPFPGSPGYEAVATCLATPDVRARVAEPPHAA